MQIETGKYYKTRDGRKVGPMVIWNNGVDHKWQIGEDPHDVCTTIYSQNGDLWNDRGVHCDVIEGAELISEWQDEPAELAALDLAALAAQHGIKITVQVGELLVEYDGRATNGQ